MKVSRGSAALVMALLIAPSAAQAREYYYFNKPGVSREAYADDRTECLSLAGGAEVKSQAIYQPPNPALTTTQSAAVAGMAALFIGMFDAARERRMSLSIERTCMADKGYGRYVVDKPVIARISGIKDQDERLTALFALAADQAPIGTKGKE